MLRSVAKAYHLDHFPGDLPRLAPSDPFIEKQDLNQPLVKDEGKENTTNKRMAEIFSTIKDHLTPAPSSSFLFYKLPRGQIVKIRLGDTLFQSNQIVFLKTPLSGIVKAVPLIQTKKETYLLVLDAKKYCGTLQEIRALLEKQKNILLGKCPKHCLTDLIIPVSATSSITLNED